jgi:hypothetical protein
VDEQARQLMDRIEQLEQTLRRLEGERGLGARARSAWRTNKWLRLATATSVLLVPLAAYASTLSVPYTFVNGTPADADEVNANFSAVESAVNDNHARINVLESAPAPGDITGVLAGSGLAGGGASGTVSLSVDPTTTQSRVTGTCAVGSSIRVIGQNGTVTCETDDVGAGGGGTITGVVAGAGLTGGGVSGSVNLAVATNGITSAHVQDGSITGTDIQDATITSSDILATTSPTFGGVSVNGTSTLNGPVTFTGGSDVRIHDANANLRFFDAGGTLERLRVYADGGLQYMYDYGNGRYVWRSDGNGLGIATAPSVGAAVTMTSLQVTGTITAGHVRVASSYALASSGTCHSAGNLTCYYGVGSAVCPAGTSVLGGGVLGSSARFGSIGYSYPNADDRWSCGSSYDSPTNHTCYAVCARID